MGKSKAAQLAELKALRASGKTRLSTYEIDEAQSVYDEVDDEGYKSVMRKRLDQDDFVVEDDGQGYADDGREDWHTERQYYESESDEEAPARGKNGSTRFRVITVATADLSTIQPNESAKKTRSVRSAPATISTSTSTRNPQP